MLVEAGASQADLLNAGAGGERVSANDILIPPVNFGPPPAPTTPVAIPFYDGIGVCWDLVADPTITGYEVRRADDAGFLLNDQVLTITQGFQYVDNKLGGVGVTKFYRVRAYRNNDTTSLYSTVVSATTTAQALQITQIELWADALRTARS
jgi:hypothetical protein